MAGLKVSKSQRAAAKAAQRMKGFDFATWRSASDDPVMRSVIIGLIVLDQAPDWERFVHRFERVSRIAPALRRG